MSTKWQRIDIPISKKYSPIEREAIATEIINFIRKRTQDDNLDKNNRKFASYSKAYTKSLDFKIARKSKGNINLTLSGDMLGALQVLGDKSGSIRIGFENGSQENARADGNIRGTYGQKSQTAPKRDFLGLTRADLASILQRFPAGTKESRERARLRRESDEAASDIVDDIDNG